MDVKPLVMLVLFQAQKFLVSLLLYYFSSKIKNDSVSVECIMFMEVRRLIQKLFSCGADTPDCLQSAWLSSQNTDSKLQQLAWAENLFTLIHSFYL